MSKSIARRSSSSITLYDPEKGLRKIADADTGAEQCRRARDTEGLLEQLAIKFKEEAKYIVWRDAATLAAQKASHGPGRGKKDFRAGAIVFSVALPKADPGSDTAHRWRKKLCSKSNGATEIDPQKIKLALEDIGHRTARLWEFEKTGTIRGTEGTGEFERYTPARYVEAAREVLGTIDLDPATSKQAQRTIKASKFFTVKDNGLAQEWHGNIWLNPPYHRDLAPKFIQKLVEEHAAGHVKSAIMLTNNCTDTDWFNAALRPSVGVCFTHGRIDFIGPNGSEVLPTQGQTFFYFGSAVERFEEIFCRIGACLRPSRYYEGGKD